MFQKLWAGATARPAPSLVADHRDDAALASADANTEGFGGFETFGRGGLDLGGLHRDQQWVGAWGGRC